MTMPSKGRRELTIGETLYHYMIRKQEYDYEKSELIVTIQNRTTLAQYITTFRQESVTPQDVKDAIIERGV